MKNCRGDVVRQLLIGIIKRLDRIPERRDCASEKIDCSLKEKASRRKVFLFSNEGSQMLDNSWISPHYISAEQYARVYDSCTKLQKCLLSTPAEFSGARTAFVIRLSSKLAKKVQMFGMLRRKKPRPF